MQLRLEDIKTKSAYLDTKWVDMVICHPPREIEVRYTEERQTSSGDLTFSKTVSRTINAVTLGEVIDKFMLQAGDEIERW